MRANKAPRAREAKRIAIRASSTWKNPLAVERSVAWPKMALPARGVGAVSCIPAQRVNHRAAAIAVSTTTEPISLEVAERGMWGGS